MKTYNKGDSCYITFPHKIDEEVTLASWNNQNRFSARAAVTFRITK